MADLVTHLASVLLPAAFVAKRPRALGALCLGVALPDLAGAAPHLGYQLFLSRVVTLPDNLFSGFGALHQPLGCALLCVLLAQAFRAEDRRRALSLLALGVAMHFAVDLLQDHHGEGYFLLFPFSMRQIELGLVGSEGTVKFAPIAAVATALAWGVRFFLARRRAAVA